MSEVRYCETVYWKEVALLMPVLGLLLIGLSIRSYVDKPVDWQIITSIMFFLGLFMLFLGVNFRKLDIVLTEDELTVRFGLARKVMPLGNIEKALTDKEARPFTLGFGIRMTRFEGEWVHVFNVIFARRAVIRLKDGKAKYFVFSTHDPEQVTSLINAKIDKAK